MLWPFQLEKRPDRLRIVVTSHSRTTGHRLVANLAFSMTEILKIPCIFDTDIDITIRDLSQIQFTYLKLHISSYCNFFQNPVVDRS